MLPWPLCRPSLVDDTYCDEWYPHKLILKKTIQQSNRKIINSKYIVQKPHHICNKTYLNLCLNGSAYHHMCISHFVFYCSASQYNKISLVMPQYTIRNVQIPCLTGWHFWYYWQITHANIVEKYLNLLCVITYVERDIKSRDQRWNVISERVPLYWFGISIHISQ